MPRALIAPAAEQVAFQEFESPPLSEGQVRVKSLYAAAKHGTEMSMFKGYAGPRGRFDSERRIFDHQGEGVQYPVPLGNMGVGEVVELGPGRHATQRRRPHLRLRAVPRRTTSGPKPRAACPQTSLGKPPSASTQRILPSARCATDTSASATP